MPCFGHRPLLARSRTAAVRCFACRRRRRDRGPQFVPWSVTGWRVRWRGPRRPRGDRHRYGRHRDVERVRPRAVSQPPLSLDPASAPARCRTIDARTRYRFEGNAGDDGSGNTTDAVRRHRRRHSLQSRRSSTEWTPPPSTSRTARGPDVARRLSLPLSTSSRRAAAGTEPCRSGRVLFRHGPSIPSRRSRHRHHHPPPLPAVTTVDSVCPSRHRVNVVVRPTFWGFVGRRHADRPNARKTLRSTSVRPFRRRVLVDNRFVLPFVELTRRRPADVLENRRTTTTFFQTPRTIFGRRPSRRSRHRHHRPPCTLSPSVQSPSARPRRRRRPANVRGERRGTINAVLSDARTEWSTWPAPRVVRPRPPPSSGRRPSRVVAAASRSLDEIIFRRGRRLVTNTFPGFLVRHRHKEHTRTQKNNIRARDKSAHSIRIR